MIQPYVFKRFSPSRLLYPSVGSFLIELEFNNIISRSTFQWDFNPIGPSKGSPVESIAESEKESRVEPYIVSLR